MMSRFPVPFLALFSMVGCDGEAGAFNRSYSAAVCERMAECAPGALEAAFGSEGECTTSVHDRLSGLQSDQNCRFDSDAAEACLNQTYRVSCEAWLEYGEPLACASVYVCSDDGDGRQYFSDDTGW